MRLEIKPVLLLLALATVASAQSESQFKVGDKVELLVSQYPEKWVPAQVTEIKNGYWNVVVTSPGGPQNTRDEYLRRAGSTRHYGEAEKAPETAAPAPAAPAGGAAPGGEAPAGGFREGDKAEILTTQYPETWVPVTVTRVKQGYWNYEVRMPDGSTQTTQDQYLRRPGSKRHYGEKERAEQNEAPKAPSGGPAPAPNPGTRQPAGAPPVTPPGGASAIGRWELNMGGVLTESSKTGRGKVLEWGNPESNGMLVIEANGTFISQAFGRVTKGTWTGAPEKLVLHRFEQDNWTATVNKDGVLKLKSDLGLWQDGHRR